MCEKKKSTAWGGTNQWADVLQNLPRELATEIPLIENNFRG